jgi:trans-aconitate methyltransferase
MKQKEIPMVFHKKTLSLCICLLSFCLSTFANEIPTKDDQWDGQQYLNNSDLQYQWATSYIQKLQLGGHEKILDIGCGDGRVTALVAQSLPHGFVLGIDASESMLQIAQNLKDRVHLGNLDFIRRDAINLGFENEFDFIVSFSCFHWIPDHFAALQAVEKALKPNGKVFLYFAPDHGRDRFDHAIHTVVNSPKWAHYFSDFSNPFSLVTPSKFAAYAEEAGLLLKCIEIITVDEVFPNKTAFTAWMTGWMSHLKELPKELHQEFLDEIIDCYLKKHPMDAENKLHYIDYWMEVELLKSDKIQ